MHRDVPNVLFEELPEEWNGYPVNTWFQIGIQMYLVSEDETLSKEEKSELILELLFPRERPPREELDECINWFLNGWCHDRSPKEKQKRKLMDFNQDQWRIYADFRQIYGINLNQADMHWWEFMGMLWNMPYRQSSFLQVIDIRKKKIKDKMSKEEKKAISDAQFVYGLDQPEVAHEYSDEEKRKIDSVDELRKRMKEKKETEQDALTLFRGG